MTDKALCDGYEYENVITYDLREGLDRFAFESKLETFIDWFEDADEVYVDENGKHRHFEINGMEVKCNIQEVSKRYRNIYYEVHVDD